MNAENPPKLRHSPLVLSLKKLNANRMNTAEFMKTSDQRPYVECPVCES